MYGVKHSPSYRQNQALVIEPLTGQKHRDGYKSSKTTSLLEYKINLKS